MKKLNNYRLIMLIVSAIIAGTSCQNRERRASTSLKPKHNEAYAQKVNSGEIKNDDFVGSIPRSTTATFDSLKITVQYGSPGVRNRVIWGKLVPYNTVWVSGANSATGIEFSKDVEVGGKHLKAGKYAFFTIPGRKAWTVIFNTDYKQHNTDDYDHKKDVVRAEIVPDTLKRAVRRLTYDVIRDANGHMHLNLAWEKLMISIVVDKALQKN